tara:strand:- start:201 stop:710 length:510 start_codon:yes stop_codon:yes gene_type:complete
MNIEELQELSIELGLTIKIQLREVLGLKFFRIVVAEISNNKVKIWGEMKGWSYHHQNGLQLDTLRILKGSPKFVSELIWATTMAWALEKTICKNARLLAIFDNAGNSKKLVRYFKFIGFNVIKEVKSSPLDLLLRLIWGGSGTLMRANCSDILYKIKGKFRKAKLLYPA